MTIALIIIWTVLALAVAGRMLWLSWQNNKRLDSMQAKVDKVMECIKGNYL